MARDLIATPSQTVGPFFHFSLTSTAALGEMARPETPGERIRLRIRVTDGAGDPVPDAIVELWQADAQGRFPQPAEVVPAAPAHTYPTWGRLPTGDDGWCEFGTIVPGPMPGPDTQAPHINVCLFMRGLLRHVYTRIYFAGDGRLEGDPLLQLVAADRRSTLLAQRSSPGVWQFEIRMQGPGETVFLNI
ncbi:MAG: protocatechuate 3,4-dioxygenase subunit alpha [Acidobacteriota bacterium]